MSSSPVPPTSLPERRSRRASWWRRALVVLSIVLLGIPRTLWRGLLICYFVLAVGILAVRWWAMPQVAAHQEEIVAALSRQLGAKLEVGELSARWIGLRPELALRAVRLYDAQGRVALELPRVDARLAWASLLYREPVLHSLEITRPDVIVRRNVDGSIYVAGFRVDGESALDPSHRDRLLRQRRVLIHDARIQWRDDKRGAAPLSLDSVSLRLENHGDRHRFALLARPPAQYAAALDVRGDLRGESLDDLQPWRGALYLSLDRADLSVWRQWVDYPVTLPQGRGGVRAWLNFEGDKVAGLTADVALRDVNVRFAPELPRLELERMSGRVRLARRDGDLTLSAERLQFATEGGLKVMPTSFSLRSRAGSGNTPAGGAFTGERMDMRVLAQFAGYLPLPAGWHAWLAQAQPRGWLSHIKASWQVAGARERARFTLDAAFDGLAMKAHDARPGFEGLSGSLRGTERGGRYALRLEKGAVELPQIMREPRIAADKAEFVGSWRHEDGRPFQLGFSKAVLANPDIALDFRGSWRDDGTADGYIDLAGRILRAQAKAAWRYIPLVAAEDVSHWLQQGLRSGTLEQGAVTLRGSLKKFPFHADPSAAFLVSGRLRDVDLHFAPDWPALSKVSGQLRFERGRMDIAVDVGAFERVRVGPVKVSIPDLVKHGEQLLVVDGKASGPTQDFLHYVSGSPLAARSGHFTDDVVARGEGVLDLHLEVPLHDSRHTRVRGGYRFAANTLRLVPGLPPFSAATGRISFSGHGIDFPQLSAEFVGGRLAGSGATQSDGTLRFALNGSLPAAGLPQLFDTPAWSYLSGQAAANAVVEVRDRQVEVRVDSQLLGIAANFPAPMRKPAQEALPLSFGWTRTKEADETRQTWRVQYGARAEARWEDVCREGRCRFRRGAIAAFEPALMPASAGLRLGGRLQEVDLDAWHPVITQILAAHAGTGDEAETFLTGAAFQAERVLASGYVFGSVRGRGMQAEDGRWSLHLEGPDLAGDLRWHGEGRGRLEARLSHLVLRPAVEPDGQGAVGGIVAAPQRRESLPALDVVADQFVMGETSLGRLFVNAVNEGAAWRLQSLRIEQPESSLTGAGLWRPGSGRRSTELDFLLETRDAGVLLARLGFKDAVRGGQARLGGQLAWQGSPGKVDYASLGGTMKLAASGGQFNKLDPGAGRLLGILSLQALPRRVTLDFRDIFSEGFAFDAIEGSMQIEKGILRTDDLRIRGPAAKIMMQGTTDLAREEHNLQVAVQPTLSETVALGVAAAQAVINPVIGLATYVAQKLLNDPIEKMFSYQYAVTGPWSDPKVEKRGAPAAAPGPRAGDSTVQDMTPGKEK